MLTCSLRSSPRHLVTSLDFLRQHVSRTTPCGILGDVPRIEELLPSPRRVKAARISMLLIQDLSPKLTFASGARRQKRSNFAFLSVVAPQNLLPLIERFVLFAQVTTNQCCIIRTRTYVREHPLSDAREYAMARSRSKGRGRRRSNLQFFNRNNIPPEAAGTPPPCTVLSVGQFFPSALSSAACARLSKSYEERARKKGFLLPSPFLTPAGNGIENESHRQSLLG